MYIVSALSGARSQEFHSPKHMCCDDVTIKVIWFDLLPFWALNVVVALLSMQSQKPSNLIKNILICFRKMKEGFMGLERHEGE